MLLRILAVDFIGENRELIRGLMPKKISHLRVEIALAHELKGNTSCNWPVPITLMPFGCRDTIPLLKLLLQ